MVSKSSNVDLLQLFGKSTLNSYILGLCVDFSMS